MKTGTTLYLVFETSGGTVDFDEITLTNKIAWEKNKNYYPKRKPSTVTVYDAATGKESEIVISDDKSIYNAIG